MYRYAYNFLLLTNDDFKHDDEMLNGVSVDVFLKLFDNHGQEVVFDNDEKEEKVVIPNSEPLLKDNEGYLYELIDVYFNPKTDYYIDIFIHHEALAESGYTLEYEIGSFEKEISNGDDLEDEFMTSVPIPIDEYEHIISNNVEKFDNEMNAPANVSSLLILDI